MDIGGGCHTTFSIVNRQSAMRMSLEPMLNWLAEQVAEKSAACHSVARHFCWQAISQDDTRISALSRKPWMEASD
jgi:hypothetical protein